jgi:hypothetical protein
VAAILRIGAKRLEFFHLLKQFTAALRVSIDSPRIRRDLIAGAVNSDIRSAGRRAREYICLRTQRFVWRRAASTE